MICNSIYSAINVKKILKKTFMLSAVATSLFTVFNANATIVQFQTNMGNFEVNLYDVNTPKTVANFLNYVKVDDYKNSIIHRSVPKFVIQGGGYTYLGTIPPSAIPENPAVVNEPVYANKRGTIAMAKIAGNPNSATNQWFINLADNSNPLDTDNGGYTVFGEVTGSGMAVVDAIAALNVVSAGSDPFTELPLNKYTQADMNANVTLTKDNLVFIQNIVVLDANVDTATAAGLSPVKTTNTNPSSSSSSTSSAATKSSSGGGGSIGWLELLALLSITTLSRLRKST